MTGTETFSNIDPRLLIVAGAAFAIFFLVLTVATAGTRSRALSRRLKTIGGRERAGTVAVGAGGKRASGPIEFMRQILNRFDLMRADKVRAIAMFLAGAGWRSKSATVLYLFAKLTLPLALGAASATLFYWVAPLLVKGNLRLPLVIFVVLIASHGLMDMLTNGGLGIALFSPFITERFFWDWRPILVSPIGLKNFISPWGLAVVIQELRWFGAPAALLIAATLIYRYMARRPSGK